MASIIGADFFRCHTTLANCFAFPLGKTILSSILLGGQYAIKNLFLFPTPVYFTPDAYSLDSFIVPYAWTLGIELLFYFVAPFIVRRSIKTIAILLALSLLSRILLFQYNLFQYIKAHQQGMLYFNMWFFPSVLFFFLIGVISYKLYVRLNTAQIPQSVYLLSTIFIVSFTLLFSTLTQLVKSNLNVIAWIYLLSVIICIPLIFNYSKRIKLDYLAGELSYAVYISHSFIIILLPRTIIFPYKDIYPLLIVFLTLLFSLLLWRFIDKPIDAYRQSRLAAIHGSNPKRKKGSSLQPPLYGSIIEAELLSTKIP